MNIQNRLTSRHISKVHGDLTIEPSGSRERLVENVRPVSRSDDDHRARLIESIHLDEQLVERLILIGGGGVAATAALASESVNLVDKDDAGRKLPALREQVSHTSSAQPSELLLKTRTRGGQKCDAGFLRRGSRQQRLAGSRRTVEQGAARNTATETTDPLRIAQKLNRLRKLRTRFVNPSHILKTDILFAVVIFKLERSATAHARVNSPTRKSDQTERQNRQRPAHDARQHSGL